MYLGIAVVVSTYQLDIVFIIGTMAACLVSRVAGKSLFVCFFVIVAVEEFDSLLLEING